MKPKIYFAGQMGLDAKNILSGCYRPFDTSSQCELADKTIITEQNFYGEPILYTGPYRNGNGNHCGVHGDSDDYTSVEGDIFSRSLDGIKQCEIFFAYFDNLEAFGTLAEVGYAYGLGKPIIIGFDHDLDDVAIDGRFIEDFRDRENPLWFVARMANTILLGSRQGILKRFRAYLQSYCITEMINQFKGENK